MVRLLNIMSKMKNYDYEEYELINYIAEATNTDKQEILNKVDKKLKNYNDTITRLAAIQFVARDEEIELDTGVRGVEISIASIRQNHRADEYSNLRNLVMFGLKTLDESNFKQHLSVENKDILIEKMKELNIILGTKRK